MKKKILLLSLCTTLLFTACGSQHTDSSAPPESSTSMGESSTAEVTTGQPEPDTNDSIEVDEGLFDVELTIPKDFMGEITQEELDVTASESGFKSITLNEDGSATYVMTKKQHKDMMAEMAVTLNDTLAAMVGSEDYPNFTDIKANEDFTKFTITTKSTELDMTESFSTLGFYMYGGMYNVFNGTPVDNVSVTFINAESGEIISTANSSDMGE